jgi:hypothetical protein
MSNNTEGVKYSQDKRKLGYLSAAPRVSTNINAEASGPRSHVLGVIQAYESLGWEVCPSLLGIE